MQHSQQEKSRKVSNDTQDLAQRAELVETNNCTGNEQLFGLLGSRQKKTPQTRASGGSDSGVALNLFPMHQNSPDPEGQDPDPHHTCVNPESHLIDWLQSGKEYEHQHTDARKPKS